MGSPERVRGCMKQDIDEDVEVNIDIVRDDEEWVGADKRKQRSSKSRGSEDLDGLDGSSRKRSTSDRHESRKRLGDSDQDDYETRRESRSKKVKKKIEENTLDVLSSWYQDGEAEYKVEGGDKPGYSRGEESEKKINFKVSRK